MIPSRASLSDIAIKNPVFSWMLMIGLIVFGAISLGRMGITPTPRRGTANIFSLIACT